jgi:glycosyltransferase involved in cell wall biosynthesis
MSSSLAISIIVSTHNRAAALRQMLDSLAKVRMPADWKAELVLVDNASTDDTALVARKACLPNMELTCLYEPRQGKSNALNAALKHARGEILLFTDDDVLVHADWVEQMVTPLAQREADAVVGQVSLAPYLLRPWLSLWQTFVLAAPDWQSVERIELVGVNMAFRRSVLERVPAFDPELGPGALGLAEETLFGLQLAEAGFKIGLVKNATITHCPEKCRLERREWLNAARKYGRLRAYLSYHWHHNDLGFPRMKWFWFWTKLHLRRILQPPPALDSEGCPPWEMSYMHQMETCRQFCIESRRPRNYARKGLTKRTMNSECG